MLEEHRTVGEPCHCSGFVTPRTLDLAGVGRDIICNTIVGAAIHLKGRPPTSIAGNRTHGFVIDRTELDRRLADQSRAAGAKILHETRFVRFEHSNPTHGARAGIVRVHVVREGVETTLRARLLVGADGAHSRVASQLHGSRLSGAVVGIGALAEYDRNPRDDHVEIFVDPESAPGWFGWTIPLGDGMARVGTGSANGVGPRESFRRLRSRFPESFGSARVHSHSGGLIPIWQPTQLTGDAVMLVGDAARQVKPTSGGGIYPALHAAGLAAHAADRALSRGDLSRRWLHAYTMAWNASLGRELRRQYDVHRAFARLDPEDLVEILERIEDGAVRRAIDERADIDFPSRVVAQLSIQKPRLMLKLLRWPRFPLAWLSGG